MHRPADKEARIELDRVKAAILKAAASPEFKDGMKRFRDAMVEVGAALAQFGAEVKKILDEDPPDDKVGAKIED